MIRALGAQMKMYNTSFVETGFTDQADLNIPRYSATTLGLPDNNRFKVTVNAIRT
jgi:hypothetical protein